MRLTKKTALVFILISVFAFSGFSAASKEEIAFVEKLNSVLSKGTLSDALELFQTMPANLQDDVDLCTLQASLLLSAGKTNEAEKIAVSLL